MTVNRYPNSLVSRVADAVAARGTARVSDLLEDFPNATKKQVHAALCNARDRRKVRVLERGSPSRGGWESLWAPEDREYASPFPTAKADPMRPPSSVWELPQQRPADDWPPQFSGGRIFQLPGNWAQDADGD